MNFRGHSKLNMDIVKILMSFQKGKMLMMFGFILTCFCLTGCYSMFSAIKPVYPTMEEGGSTSTLVLINNVHSQMMNERLNLAVDGFSPTDKLYLPKGKTEILLQAGNHEMTHFLDTAVTNEYEKIKTKFNTEAGKVYVINFDMFMERRQEGFLGNKRGYRILYGGWSDEETSKWPAENISGQAFL